MYYEEVIVKGEMFIKTEPQGDWVKATNKMLTAKWEQTVDELAAANETLARIKELIQEHGI